MSKMATREAYGKALVELGKNHENIIVLDADLSKSTKTALFKKEFPNRFFSTGIAEANMIGVAAGLAAAGKVPFVSSFALFATGRAFEQIRNSVCYPNLNVKIAATHSGVTVGPDGGSHQSVEDIAIMRAIPNMTVLVPADGVSTKKMIKLAYEFDGPVYIRLGRPSVETIYNDDEFFAIGQAKQLANGHDATIIACGLMVQQAVEASKQLAKTGIKVRVLDMTTVKPLDIGAVIKAAEETGAIVTAEEHSVIGGLGSAVATLLAEQKPVPVQMVGVRDRFGQSGSPNELLVEYNLMATDIIEAVKKVINRK
ncbi:transketolase family protein [Clostridium sp. 'deep sea']|uniref:transketolase family protein n=1 Tax=Clostridium sp. 'deep sea' TaxID=2779445 RepID=UPI001896A17E|nr:transketolase family protein [Clostridium sp. 'deep sea']QOR33680.1 transketolase family protein [Clostridium sp. 'deep sea']